MFFIVTPLHFKRMYVTGSWKTRSPVIAPISYSLARSKIMYIWFSAVMGFCRPSSAFFTKNILRAPTIGGRVFDFPRKIWGKKFSYRIFPAMWMPVPYPLSLVAERSTLIGMHGPLWRNYPEDIYLPFFWVHECIFPISLSIFEPIVTVKRTELRKFIDYFGLSIETNSSRVGKNTVYFVHTGSIPIPSSVRSI